MPYIIHQYPTFQHYLKNLLIEKNETATNLAMYLGVSRSYISQIVRGKTNVSRYQIEAIMKALGRPPVEFFNTLEKDK
jgi:transcriptional regulator with XRE-family HTH domain